MNQPRPKRGDVEISLAVLIVEDSESDALLIIRLLKKAGYEVVFERVETAGQMHSALNRRAWDIVISDYSLPQFGGYAALELLKEEQPHIPFIVVSGAIGEERAAAMMKAGAHDYVIKDNLVRLAPAVKRELEQAVIRQERKQAEQSLRESEEKYRMLVEQASDAIFLANPDGQYLDVNPAGCKLSGYTREEILQLRMQDIAKNAMNNPIRFKELEEGMVLITEREMIRKDGTIIIVEISARQLPDGNLQGIARDITERKRAEDALRESEAFNLAILQNSPIGISVRNCTGQLLSANEAWKKIWAIPEFDVHKDFTRDRPELAFDDRDDYLSSHKEEVRRVYEKGGQLYLPELKITHPRIGAAEWISQYFYAIQGADGQVARVVILTENITERKQAEGQLRKLSSAVEHSPSAILITDADGKIEYVNPKFTAVNGYTLHDVRGKTPRILKSDKTPPEVYTKLWQTILSGKEWRGEFLNRRKNGELYWEYASISAITDSTGAVTHFVSVNEDVTARKEAEEKIMRLNAGLELLAMTDHLTSLYNRRYFMQRGTEEFKRAWRTNQPLALLMLDVDHFKMVNDTHGHEAGDMTLQQIAAALKSCLRETDILGRMGGEEFSILLPNTHSKEAGLLAERIRQSVGDAPFEIPGKFLTVTISIGATVITDEMSGIDDMLRNADAAMYCAKRCGGNRVVQYEDISDADQ